MAAPQRKEDGPPAPIPGPGGAEASVSYDTDAILTVPNVLSFIRLLGVPLFVVLILQRRDWSAVAVLAAASLTDLLDGKIARHFHQVSKIGQQLDPVADRLYILVTLVALAIREIIPWWFVAILFARDLMLMGLLPVLGKRGYSSLPVNFVGKAATFCLLIALPLILVGSAGDSPGVIADVLGWATAIWGAYLYWWSDVLYVVQTRDLVRALNVGEKGEG